MAMPERETMTAVCGLDCSTCDIRLAEGDPEIAKRLAKGFSEKGIIPDATPDMFRCDGCRGDRTRHWSANCRILHCCIDEKGYEYCNQCEDFPCSVLKEWAERSESHGKALERLKGM